MEVASEEQETPTVVEVAGDSSADPSPDLTSKIPQEKCGESDEEGDDDQYEVDDDMEEEEESDTDEDWFDMDDEIDDEEDDDGEVKHPDCIKIFRVSM